jgi:hypothetical protein
LRPAADDCSKSLDVLMRPQRGGMTVLRHLGWLRWCAKALAQFEVDFEHIDHLLAGQSAEWSKRRTESLQVSK